MRTLISLSILALTLFSCNYQGSYSTTKSEKEWVYIEVETTMLYDTTNYFYYGQISKKLSDRLTNNEESGGFFQLSNIRYYNTNDLLTVHENKERRGTLIFRVEDIQFISILKDDPAYTFDENELHESAKRIRMAKRK